MTALQEITNVNLLVLLPDFCLSFLVFTASLLVAMPSDLDLSLSKKIQK